VADKGKHASILTDFQTKVNKKIKKFTTKTQRHEEYSHRGQRELLANFGVFGRAFPLSELLRKAQPYPPGHFSMPHLGSWLKPSFHQHGFNQQKNGQKVLFRAVLFPIEIRTLSPIISLKCAEFL